MRLEPIDKPRGFVMRLAYWGMRRKFGKVMTTVKVIGPRMPAVMRLSNAISNFELKKITLEHSLHYMIGTLTAQINGCAFCTDLGRSMAIRENIGLEKFNALDEYKASPLFSERERAALAYVEEATRNKHVSDVTFGELRRHFNDKEIVEITWVNAIENYYNMINIPLGIGSDGFCEIVQAKKRNT